MSESRRPPVPRELAAYLAEWQAAEEPRDISLLRRQLPPDILRARDIESSFDRLREFLRSQLCPFDFASLLGQVVQGKLGQYRLRTSLKQSKRTHLFIATPDGSPQSTYIVKFPDLDQAGDNADKLERDFDSEMQRVRIATARCGWLAHVLDWGTHVRHDAGRRSITHPFFVMPQYDGDITNHLPLRESFPSAATIILSVIGFLHDRMDLFHGDIKPANFLTKKLHLPSALVNASDKEAVAVPILADFESVLPMTSDCRVRVWTRQYAPGFVNEDTRWTIQCEMHTLAVTLAEILTGVLPARAAGGEFTPHALEEHVNRCVPGDDPLRGWGPMLDRTVTGEFDSVKALFREARRSQLISDTAAAYYGPPTPEVRNVWVMLALGAVAGYAADEISHHAAELAPLARQLLGQLLGTIGSKTDYGEWGLEENIPLDEEIPSDETPEDDGGRDHETDVEAEAPFVGGEIVFDNQSDDLDGADDFDGDLEDDS